MPDELPSYGPKECGSCRLWRPILEDERGPIGPCRLGVRTGDFPGTAPICERYLARDEAIPVVSPPAAHRHRATALRPVIVRRAEPESEQPDSSGVDLPARPAVPADRPPLNLPEELTDMTREEFAQAIRQVLREESADVALAPKWEGGTVVLRPGDSQTQPKEIPLDALFHKLVMIRDRLRVLEQKINAHPKLSDAEKVEMQQYVTKCYGSLTTFNILFREEKDRFVGEKG
jgi:hypothetical protein